MVFKNNNGQIRSGWKILLTFISASVPLGIIGAVIGIVYVIIKMATTGMMSEEEINQILNGNDPNSFMNIVLNILQNVTFIAAVWLFWKFLDKKPIREIGLTNIKKNYKDLFVGLLFGALSMSVVFGILIVMGSSGVVNGITNPKASLSLLTWLVVFIFVGFGEEIFSRGYCMTVLKQTNSKWAPVVISSLIFSVMHGMNPNVTVTALLNIFLVGLLFAYMTLKSGNLWMAIGYHITWNYFQGNIFGFEVSGLAMEGLYNTRPVVENILNGGKFGPEGGIITTIVLLLGFAYTRYIYKKKEV